MNVVNKVESVDTLQSRCMHLSLVIVWLRTAVGSVVAETGF